MRVQISNLISNLIWAMPERKRFFSIDAFP